MRRRDFVKLAAGAAAALPIAARAQPSQKLRRIGVLMSYPEGNPDGQTDIAAFREGLEKLGWTEGRNILIDIRWAVADNLELIQRFAKELVTAQPDLILSHNTPTTIAVLRQTHSIPVIFVIVVDPVGSGFVESLGRPGGNATGFTNFEPGLAAKWLGLLKTVAPRVTRVAMLFNPKTAPYAEFFLKPFGAVAPSLGIEAITAPVHDATELEPVIAAQAREPNGGLIAIPDSFMLDNRTQMTFLAARYRLPAVSWHRSFPEGGGLLSYGNERVDHFRRAAVYADRIFNGAKPAELPVEFPTKFELVINLKTAKELGLEVPTSLLSTADEVIE